MLSHDFIQTHRRAGVNDIVEINRLLQSVNYYSKTLNSQQTNFEITDTSFTGLQTLFGWQKDEAAKIIERSVLTLVRTDNELSNHHSDASSQSISSVTALSLAPLLPFIAENHPLSKFYRDIQKTNWTDFINKTFFDDDHSSSMALQLSNSLYLSAFSYDETVHSYSNGPMLSLKSHLQTSFALAEHILYICYLLPIQCSIPDFMIGNVPIFSKWISRSPSFPFHLVLFHRKTIFPPLKIRRARVEDCDDLVPLFKQHNMLPADAGDYQVAQILESNDPSCVSLVGENASGKAVAFISLSTKVSMDSMLSSFALDTFLDLLNKPENTLANNLSSLASLQVSLQNLTAIRQPDMDSTDDDVIQKMASTVHNAETHDLFTLATGMRAESLDSLTESPVSDAYNAFCIKLYCIDDNHIHHSSEFLKALFASFPHRDYCFITLPTDCPEFPLLTRFNCIPPLSNKQPNHILYMAHRYGHQNCLSLKRGMHSEIEKVFSLFFEDDPQASKWLDKLHASDEEFDAVKVNGCSFFIVQAFDQTVGLIILSHRAINDYINEFDVDHWIEPELHLLYGRLNIIESFYLNPLFASHARNILKNLLTLAETSALFYVVSEPCDYLTLSLLRREFVPLRPRRLLYKSKFNHSLWFFCSNMVYEPRAIIHDRLVFVGASECALSTLQELIFHEHYFYSQLALITPEGYPSSPLMAQMNNILRPDCVGFPVHVMILSASIAQIIRKTKRVRLLQGGMVKYDYLILCFGKSFTSSAIHPFPSHSTGHVPFDSAHLDYICKIAKAPDTPICVVGNHPAAFHAINVLLSMGVSVDRLCHIVDGPPLNPHIAQLVAKAYKETSLRLVELSSFQEIDVEFNSENQVRGLRINDDYVPCSLLILAAEKQVSFLNFKVVHEASLVYDDGIVIDSNFATCDPYIYAAGSATRYTSKYFITWKQSQMNSIAVGKLLGKLFTPPGSTIFDNSLPPEPLAEPLIRCCKVLLNYAYLEILSPDPLAEELEYLKTHRDVHFSIGLNPSQSIQKLLYFGDKDIDSNRFAVVYGLNERYFHRLLSRFKNGLINDFFEYFHLSKFDPIFYDRFSSAMKHFRSYLETWDLNGSNMPFSLSHPLKPEEEAQLMKWFEESEVQARTPAEASLNQYLKEVKSVFMP